jgi:hypothetical protein
VHQPLRSSRSQPVTTMTTPYMSFSMVAGTDAFLPGSGNTSIVIGRFRLAVIDVRIIANSQPLRTAMRNGCNAEYIVMQSLAL